MKKFSRVLIIACIVATMLTVVSYCAVRFLFLAPFCYSDNEHLTEQENYSIKRLVLESVKDRLSPFSKTDRNIYAASANDIDVIQLDEEQVNLKRVFIAIDSGFMDTVEKTDEGYIVYVKTYGMESVSTDCVYEIRISEDFYIIGFSLNP